ncbi:MAG: hypothetical protein SGBAC_007118 [Bacillariaceae sp.]
MTAPDPRVELPPTAVYVQNHTYCFSGCEALVTASVQSSLLDRAEESGEETRNNIVFGCELLMSNNDTTVPIDDRFEHLPVHNLCHNSSQISVSRLFYVLDCSEFWDDTVLVDTFGMTPLHILATSTTLNDRLLKCLLTWYPLHILCRKDNFQKTVLDYLLMHTSGEAAVPLIQMILNKVIVERMSKCGIDKADWQSQISRYVNLMSCEDGIGIGIGIGIQRTHGVQRVFQLLGYCLRLETTSLIELAVWKMRISELHNDNVKVALADRASCLCQSGADAVIENVFAYLWGGESDDAIGLSMVPLASTLRTDSE